MIIFPFQSCCAFFLVNIKMWSIVNSSIHVSVSLKMLLNKSTFFGAIWSRNFKFIFNTPTTTFTIFSSIYFFMRFEILACWYACISFSLSKSCTSCNLFRTLCRRFYRLSSLRRINYNLSCSIGFYARTYSTRDIRYNGCSSIYNDTESINSSSSYITTSYVVD